MSAEFLYVEVLENDARTGFRVHTSDDAPYEALDGDEYRSRIYPTDTGWTAKINFPVEDRRESYDTFRTVADRIEDTYEIDLPMTWLAFDEAYDEGGARIEKDRYMVEYNTEGGLSIPTDDPGVLASVPGMAMLGNVVGGGTGLAVAGTTALPMWAETIALGSPFIGVAAGVGLAKGIPATKEAVQERRRKRRYGDLDRATDTMPFEARNERNGLAALLDRNKSFPETLTDRYHDLVEKDLDEPLDILYEAQFAGFDEHQGINAVATCDSYADAAAFRAAVQGSSAATCDRPTLFQNPAAFRSMFDHLTHGVEGERYVLEDAYLLTTSLLEADDADPGLVEWMEETHPDILARAGRQHVLEQGGDKE